MISVISTTCPHCGRKISGAAPRSHTERHFYSPKFTQNGSAQWVVWIQHNSDNKIKKCQSRAWNVANLKKKAGDFSPCFGAHLAPLADPRARGTEEDQYECASEATFLFQHSSPQFRMCTCQNVSQIFPFRRNYQSQDENVRITVFRDPPLVRTL